jgi:hypothetical protein
MHRWKMRAVAGLAVIALAAAGCQDQGTTHDLDTLDATPSVDQSLPSRSDATDASPSIEASPSGS